MFKKVLVILVILCSIEFFTIILVPEVVLKAAPLLGIGLTLAMLLLMGIYDRTPAIPRNFTIPVVILLVSALVSTFAAYGFWNQNLEVTLWAQRSMYFYLFYFLLSKFRLHPDILMKAIIFLGGVYMLIYIGQSIIYPIKLVSYRVFSDRGTLRIFMPGAGYLQLGYYLCLYLFFRDYKLSNLAYVIGALVVFVLVGSRQLLASIGLITIIFLLLNRVVRVKALLIPLMISSVIPIYFLFQDVFIAMLDVTSNQGSDWKNDIRVRAASFFLTDFFPSPFAYLTGNGTEGTSSIYGLKVQGYALRYGFFQSDIGLIGDYVKFGPLFLIGVFASLFTVIRAKLTGELIFVKYFILGVILMLFTGSSAFGNGGNIVVLCLVFYIVDASLYINANPELEKKGELFIQ